MAKTYTSKLTAGKDTITTTVRKTKTFIYIQNELNGRRLGEQGIRLENFRKEPWRFGSPSSTK
jgi:hypothetical protein